MAKRIASAIICASALLNLSLYFSPSFAAADDASVYTTFLKCLENNTSSGEDISSLVYAKTNPSYTSVLRAYIRNSRLNTPTTPKPVIIITPKNISHVQAAVICTKQVGYQLKIRSGGHDYEGLSYVSENPFFILDMNNLRSVEIDMASQSAWIQAGALLGEVYYKISQSSKVHGFPAGICPTVGVGGHFGGGGYGAMIRKYGLAVDHILDAQIVDVNGKLMNRKEMGEDLFWAIRGGGAASFGVVISYQIQLVSVPETVTVFRIESYVEDNGLDIAFKWQSVAPKTNSSLFMRMLMQPVTRNKQNTLRVTVMSLYLGDADSLVTLLGKDFPELGLKKENCTEMSWIQSVLWWANYDDLKTKPEVLLDRKVDTANFLKRKSDYVQKPIPKNSLSLIFKKMVSLGKIGLVFNAYGGRMDEIPSTELPFPHRAGNLYKMQYSINWEDDEADQGSNYLGQSRTLYAYMTPFVSQNPRSAFLNYRDLDIGTQETGKDSYEQGKIYGAKYFNGNFDRLVKIKTAVDPENFFRNEQSIPTLPKKA